MWGRIGHVSDERGFMPKQMMCWMLDILEPANIPLSHPKFAEAGKLMKRKVGGSDGRAE